MSDEPMTTDGTLERETSVTATVVGGAAAQSKEVGMRRQLGRGAAVGRYLVLGPLGAGGMGVVYEGYDPELDRRVALKLLRPDRQGPDASQRLFREARAIARLAHPNIVAVYDVGTVGEQLFVAMELVVGSTLREWLDERPRGFTEIVERFLAAGRGLEAAHAAGLVHRDVKPENILVGFDGRVRVADFGLVRPSDDAPNEQAPIVAVRSDDSDREDFFRDESLTRAGSVLGTPGYMAPEQRRGEQVDELSDQYSFAVALYEGLYGHRSARGEVAATPERCASGERVPESFRRALDRALSDTPARRFPAMTDLLAALASERETRRRRRVAITAMAAFAALLVGGVLWRASHPKDLCAGSEAKLAGVWSAERKAAIHKVFASAGPRGLAAWSGLERALDRYTKGWLAMRRQACEATRVTGEQSEDLLDRRMLCLDSRLSELRALSAFLLHADLAAIARGPRLAEGLGEIAACADLAGLAERVAPPRDPTLLTRIEALRARLDAGKAFQAAARFSDAIVVVEKLLPELREVGDFAQLAEAHFLRSSAESELGNYEAAVAHAFEALWAAEGAHDDRLRVRAWSRLAYVHGVRLARPEEADRYVRATAAAALRAGNPPDLQAIAIGAEVAQMQIRGRAAESLPLQERALRLLESQESPDDDRLVAQLSGVAQARLEAGDLRGAEADYRRAQETALRAFGPDHPDTASALYNLGVVLSAASRYSEAVESFRGALTARERLLDPDHPDLAESWMGLGTALEELGRYDEASAAIERAIASWERTLPPNHLSLGWGYANRGEVALDRGRGEEAIVAFRRARPIVVAAMGGDGGPAMIVESGIGRSLVASGRDAEAIAVLERARAGLESSPLGASFLPEVQFALACALWRSGRDRPRAVALARASREGFAALGPTMTADLEAVDAWLAEREVTR